MNILDQETIDWISVAESLPDDDTTVLIYAPGSAEPVWMGWYYGEDDEWFTAESMPFKAGEVMAWANMPRGVGFEPAKAMRDE